MKISNLLLIFLLSFFISNHLYSQTNCDSLITPPFTDDMADVTGPCEPAGGIIYTYQQYQNSSDGVDSILGVPIDEVRKQLEGISDSTSSAENMTDLLAANVGNMSVTELMECFDVLCSPQLALAQENVNQVADAFNNSGTVDVGAIVLEEGEGHSQSEAESELGLNTGDLDNLGTILGDSLSNMDLQSLIADALGMDLDCSGDSPWGEIEIFDPNAPDDPNDPFQGEGGGQFKKKLEKKVSSMLEAYMSDEQSGDPNWLLGEIEGLGMASPSNLMPSPSATNTINSIQSGANLYNGSGYFNLPLDNISSKDVNASIGINSTPGGLKVDDQEGLLGSNMDISAGGKITRVVKGLPDEFYGDIESYAYGTKRGLKPVVEFSGVDIGIDFDGPGWLKGIVCKLIQTLIQDLLNINITGGCVPGATESADALADQPVTGYQTQQFVSNLPGGLGAIEEWVKKERGFELGGLFGDDNDDDPSTPGDGEAKVGLRIYWVALHPNYGNVQLIIKIPIAGKVDLVIKINFRVGAKIVETPSEVLITKKGIGFTHLMDEDKMSGLSVAGEAVAPIDINNFAGLSQEEKFKYLTKQYSTKKRSDKEFFNPKAFYFQEILSNIADLFNTDENNPYPIYNTEQLDLEPDEYYYEFGGYSGKFYIQPSGKVVLVPYQDFFIHIDKELVREDSVITSFTFTTPQGIEYTFDQKAQSSHNHYSLPTSFKYPEIGKDNTTFGKPQQGKVEHPLYKWWMGTPLSMEIRKDYMTNYYVERGVEYTSAWHVTNIHSNITQEEIDFTYSTNYMTYNSSKNWSHNFPNFKKEGDEFKTNPNSSFGLQKKTEWKNGFADLTYSISEVAVDEVFLETIDNRRGKKAVFHYEQDNGSIIGGKLCTKIEILKNDQLYKGWIFNYDTPTQTQTDVVCNIPSTNTEEGQGPIYSIDGEYKLNFVLSEDDPEGTFLYRFPMVISIMKNCLRFVIPIKLKLEVKKHKPDNHFLNSISELGSLLELKVLLGIKDEKEITRFNNEKVRNFLRDVIEIGVADPIASIEYTGDLGSLPKRYSIHQDVWGNYRTSSTMSPFIKSSYSSMLGGHTNGNNTDHFAFYHPSVTQEVFAEGRDWEANLEEAKIGQINKITLETGAFLKYDYDLHKYPLGLGSFIEGVQGGLRMKGLIKGSSNGPTNATFYKYSNPTVVNFPLFSSQHYIDEYYKGYERKVKTGWKPLNEWHMNKGGYIGYGLVEELIHNEVVYNDDGDVMNEEVIFSNPDHGKIAHYFTTPEKNVSVITPATEEIRTTQKRFLRWGPSNYDIGTFGTSYHSPFAPLIVKNWRLGLEERTIVYNAENQPLQETNTDFTYPEMGVKDGYGIIHFPKTQMFQFMSYGSYTDLKDDGALYNIVDAGTKCYKNKIFQLVRFFMKIILTEHPYRYIDKDFYIADMYAISEKVETRLSSTINTFYVDGDVQTNSSSTEYTYLSSEEKERKLFSTFQTLSSGETIRKIYQYADTYSSQYSFLNGTILTEMDNKNYEVPVGEVVILNENYAKKGGSFTNYKKYGTRFLAESVWGLREGNIALTGVFESYQTTLDPEFPDFAPAYMPKVYRLAKYGTGSNIGSYQFFPSVNMTWNGSLLLKTRTMSGYTTTNHFNDLCQLEWTSDVNGLTTNYTYDTRRRLESTISPNALQTTTYGYQMNPLTISTTMSFSDNTANQGQIQRMDGWGNMLNVERVADGAVLSSTQYDNLFRPVVQTQLGSGATEITYETNPLGRTYQITDAVGNVTTTEYLGPEIPDNVLEYFRPDHSGYKLFAGSKVTDPNNHISYGWADGLGKGSVSVSGEGGVTVSKYNSQERLEEVVNPIEEKYKYTYNQYTGLLATKKIPGKTGDEQYWYDKSMRMVAKTDPNGNTLVMEYDNIYRVETIRFAPGASFGSTNGIPLAEGSVDGTGTTVLQNTYVPNKTWMQEVTEGILKNGGVSGSKTITYSLDGLGRVNEINSTYSTGVEIQEVFAPLTAAGLSEDVTKVVTKQGVPNSMDYHYTYDNVLRTLTTTLDYNGQSTLLEELVYNGLDQLEFKKIGGTGNGFLQTVTYDYDGAGKLIAINSPFESGCVADKEVCQLYWGSAEVEYDETACGLFTGINIDESFYELDTHVPASESATIESFINNKIQELGFLGGVEVHYKDFTITSDFYISFMETDVPSASIVFENCTFDLEQKNCCNVIAIGQNGMFPVPESPTNPSLFFEKITYTGMDISLIEMAGSCTAGLIRNQYQYDADHRLINVHNELFNPQKTEGAFSTDYSYDPAGNIMTLNRKGWVAQVQKFLTIDSLTYEYEEVDQSSDKYTSRLMKVSDKYNKSASDYTKFAQPVGFKGKNVDSESVAKAFYSYDGNGNLLSDSGKGLSATYNLLNLPESIGLTGGAINHEYTFSGEKIKKIGAETIEYYGGLEYRDGELELVHIPNGRILEGGKYQYKLTDHLGNVVVMFEDKSGDGKIQLEEETNGVNDEVLQRNHYYSFGMRVNAPGLINNGMANNKYLYNGKELNSDFGLDWSDYGARYYDAAIGRWNGVDILADKYAKWSSYNYVGNNPILFIDPNGMYRSKRRTRRMMRRARRNGYTVASYSKSGDTYGFWLKTNGGYEFTTTKTNFGTNTPIDGIREAFNALPGNVGYAKKRFDQIATIEASIAVRKKEKLSGITAPIIGVKLNNRGFEDINPLDSYKSSKFEKGLLDIRHYIPNSEHEQKTRVLVGPKFWQVDAGWVTSDKIRLDHVGARLKADTNINSPWGQLNIEVTLGFRAEIGKMRKLTAEDKKR